MLSPFPSTRTPAGSMPGRSTAISNVASQFYGEIDKRDLDHWRFLPGDRVYKLPPTPGPAGPSDAAGQGSR